MLAPKPPSSGLLGLQFCFFNIVLLAFSTFLPTFLVSVRGYSLVTAGLVTSPTTVTMVSCPLGGWHKLLEILD